jgi:hypothetical protein
MKNLISQQAYDAALKKGKRELAERHAVSARFNARGHKLTIVFSNGFECAVDVREAAVLRDYPDADLSDAYVTPGGDGLIFDKAGLQVGLPALIAPFLPPEIARAARAANNGKIISKEKASAARRNGALGGRPRREHATAKTT